jgi:hypothetical protein
LTSCNSRLTRGCLPSSAMSRSSAALTSIAKLAPSLEIRVLRLEPCPCSAAHVTGADALRVKDAGYLTRSPRRRGGVSRAAR